MEIAGEWQTCEDGVMRPMVRVTVVGADAAGEREWFLIDPGADRTVLSADFFAQLSLSSDAASDASLQGIGGNTAFVNFTAALEIETLSGGSAVVRGTFAAFVDPTATDFSILGRDVLDNFDLIIARQRGDIRLLAPNHRYHVSCP